MDCQYCMPLGEPLCTERIGVESSCGLFLTIMAIALLSNVCLGYANSLHTTPCYCFQCKMLLYTCNSALSFYLIQWELSVSAGHNLVMQFYTGPLMKRPQLSQLLVN